MTNEERIAHLLERPSTDVVADIHAALATSFTADPALVDVYLAERLIDHDLRRLLSSAEDDQAFVRGVLVLHDDGRQDTRHFAARVVEHAVSDRPTDQHHRRRTSRHAHPWSWHPLLACAAMVLLLVGVAWFALGRQASSGTTPVTTPPAIAVQSVATDVIATVEITAGRLLLTGKDGSAKPVTGMHDLVVGDRVALSSEPGSARLRWRDGTIADLQPGTTLTLAHSRELRLENGLIHARVTPVGSGEPWRFVTEQGRIQVVGTAFTLSCQNALTTVAMEEGSVEATHTLGHHRVSAGMQVRLHPDRAPDPPRPIAAGGLWLGRLGQTWKPLFDGQTLSLLAQESAVGWTVDGGALVPVEPLAQREAAQTVAGFADVEIRIRFTVVGSGYAHFVGRQGEGGGTRVAFPDVLKQPGRGEHELELRYSGDQESALLDGTSWPMERRGQRQTGCLQFNAWNRCLRITRVDVRDP